MITPEVAPSSSRPLSQWLHAALRQAGFAVELLETRHAPNALKIMPVKTDRNDARGIAELMRLGWFRPVHCKSMEAQERRASYLISCSHSDRGHFVGFGGERGRIERAK